MTGGRRPERATAPADSAPVLRTERLVLNRTLAEEWAYAQVFTNSQHRADALAQFLHHYNHHRAHTALAGQPPITRINNLTGHYT
ncbi:Integrase core domain [Actinoalloteichus sp. GBA129-24]|uniref:Integrase core domain n=1 Tax=Actinoalloteichus fjordicus TaxID=1612552 RepID=A0AAC9LET2_9PSEU|nr:Integrase core domain [Actinoalloteichus fjordicus]APU20879.1 Integrase core domain [Actinoalloteichus sp. GBA129-24]